MYYYFSAITPLFLRLGGANFGVISEGVRAVDLDGAPLIEALSLNGESGSFNFFPTDEFLSSPPEFATVTDMQGGYLIKIMNFPVKKGFAVIKQERIGNALITVFNDDGYKISIDSSGFYSESLPFPFTEVKICPLSLSGRSFICVIYKSEKYFIDLYDDKCEKVFSAVADDFSLSGGLFTVELKNDIAGHRIERSFGFIKEKIAETDRKVSYVKPFSVFSLPEKILPFAFAEELLCGGDLSPYISGELNGKIGKIKEFFGDFIGVTPPPTFRSFDEVGLVYRTGNRTYRIEYATFSVENRKITNFKIT